VEPYFFFPDNLNRKQPVSELEYVLCVDNNFSVCFVVISEGSVPSNMMPTCSSCSFGLQMFELQHLPQVAELLIRMMMKREAAAPVRF